MDHYESNVQKVMELLKAKHFCRSSQASHVKCYQEFQQYLDLNGLSISNESIHQWLDTVKTQYGRQRYAVWRKYLGQLQEMSVTGTVADDHLYLIRSTYDKVHGKLKVSLDEYLESCKNTYTKRSWKFTKTYCSGIMKFFGDHGIVRIDDLTYCDIIALYTADLYCEKDTRYVYLSHARLMLEYFAEKGHCRRQYSMILDTKVFPYISCLSAFKNENQEAIRKLREESQDFPAEEFLAAIDDFVTLMETHGYKSTPLHVAKHTLTSLYLFLEHYDLGYLPKISWIWFDEIQPAIGVSWKKWRRVLKDFEQYTENGDLLLEKRHQYLPNPVEALPEWCREPIYAFMEMQKKEFHSDTTVDKSKYPCIRFCRFLVEHEIKDFKDVTPKVIAEFSRTDQHETLKGRSGYFTVIRQFVEFLERKNLVQSPTLHIGITTGTAPVERIVEVLTDEEVQAIYDYRKTHSSPIELRNIAMVMVGLKTGLRASDVVNLKLTDIDWKKHQICIVQQKTHADITLPLPVEVGNSIYTYMKNGRPKEAKSDHIFVCHKAPFDRITTKNCSIALWSILPDRKSMPGGFHITRRTFATRLLRNNAGIQQVIDSLGHHDNSSVMKYLSLDDDRMRSCALSLDDTGLTMRKGGLL